MLDETCTFDYERCSNHPDQLGNCLEIRQRGRFALRNGAFFSHRATFCRIWEIGILLGALLNSSPADISPNGPISSLLNLGLWPTPLSFNSNNYLSWGHCDYTCIDATGAGHYCYLMFNWTVFKSTSSLLPRLKLRENERLEKCPHGSAPWIVSLIRASSISQTPDGLIRRTPIRRRIPPCWYSVQPSRLLASGFSQSMPCLDCTPPTQRQGVCYS